MRHFVTEMCTCAHFCYKMVHCGILEYLSNALWDVWDLEWSGFLGFCVLRTYLHANNIIFGCAWSTDMFMIYTPLKWYIKTKHILNSKHTGWGSIQTMSLCLRSSAFPYTCTVVYVLRHEPTDEPYGISRPQWIILILHPKIAILEYKFIDLMFKYMPVVVGYEGTPT